MRYLLVALLLFNFGYFGWSLLAPPRSESPSEPPPLRDSGLQLVNEARTAEREKAREQAEEEDGNRALDDYRTLLSPGPTASAARLHDARRVSSKNQGQPLSVSHVLNPHKCLHPQDNYTKMPPPVRAIG